MKNEIEQARADIKEYEGQVTLKDAVIRLKANPDFKAVFEDYFFGAEAMRYLQASTDPNLGATERADALAIAQSSSHVKRFMNVLIQMGRNAERSIKVTQEALAEMVPESSANTPE